jgi:hypothetical protein
VTNIIIRTEGCHISRILGTWKIHREMRPIQKCFGEKSFCMCRVSRYISRILNILDIWHCCRVVYEILKRVSWCARNLRWFRLVPLFAVQVY